jgi:L-rhamnose isomerase
MNTQKIEQAYRLAQDRYSASGVNTQKALKALAQIPLSLHCWQGDDVTGFENKGGLSGGGIQTTGNYPGKARSPAELRDDLEMAFRMIPGHHRLNLHALYAETGAKAVPRNELEPRHFANWVEWARIQGLGLDFNPSCFSHPLANGGFTLSSRDAGIRRFWVEHAIACRRIGASFGRRLGTPCVTNLWIPDGFKDTPVDRRTSRSLLKESLDAVFAESISEKWNLDAVEGKLFGIGSESCVIGSHEFYLGYAIKNHKLICLDAGHYHPTESIADKISSVLFFLDAILLHVSRGVRWDSDHVVTLTDDLRAIAEEIVRSEALDRIHIGLDYFDASINRVAAWVIGARNMMKALLIALLEPAALLRKAEARGDFTSRLALQEEAKSLPFAAVWDYFCMIEGVPVGDVWLTDVRRYEASVLSRRKS